VKLRRLEDQAGLGQVAVDQMRPVLDLLQPSLDHPHQFIQAGHREVGQPAAIE
jgi:hypothetical protein